jgi:hypothetical protein
MSRLLPLLALVLGLAAVACGVYAWQLRGQLGESEAELAAQAKELARLQMQLASAEQEARRAPEQGPTGGEQAATATANPTTTTPEAGRATPPRGEGNVSWRNSPEAQRLMAIQRRAGLDGRYAALFRKLNLSPADLEKFKALLVDKQSAAMDVMSTAREQGLNPRENREQIGALIRSFEAETDASIRATLGEAAYQQYQQYEQTAPQRGMVNQIEQRLSYSTTPLYGNQAEQLVSLFAASAPAGSTTTRGPMAGPAGPTGGRNVTITDSIIAQAEGFLSSPQVEALRQLQQEQLAQVELRQQMQQARRTNSGGDAPTPTPLPATGP